MTSLGVEWSLKKKIVSLDFYLNGPTFLVGSDDDASLPLTGSEAVVRENAHFVLGVRLEVLNVELSVTCVAHSLSAQGKQTRHASWY